MTASPTVSTIIVNYGAANLICAHLPDLCAQHAAFPGSDIIIVDNASPNEDARHLDDFLASTPGLACPVTFIAHDRNDGFGAGNNVGLNAITSRDAAPPDFVLFLNPDAFCDPAPWRPLLRHFSNVHRPVSWDVGSRTVREHRNTVPFSFFPYPVNLRQRPKPVRSVACCNVTSLRPRARCCHADGLGQWSSFPDTDGSARCHWPF